MARMGLAETIEALKAEGYVKDFNLRANRLECEDGELGILADDLEIDAVFRFDVMSDPSDQAVLYAIRSRRSGAKGVLVNSFGIYSEPSTNELVAALQRAEQRSRNPAA